MHALTRPSDGTTHPVWRAKSDIQSEGQSGKLKASYFIKRQISYSLVGLYRAHRRLVLYCQIVDHDLIISIISKKFKENTQYPLFTNVTASPVCKRDRKLQLLRIDIAIIIISNSPVEWSHGADSHIQR